MNDKNSFNPGQVEGLATIIARAQQGDRPSMGRLAKVADARLRTYVFRLTLSRDITEELCQKILMNMVKSLKTLKNIDKFWFWLLKDAMSEVQHYYRDQKRRQEIDTEALNREYFTQYVARNHHDGLDQTARIELSETIYEAVAQLRFTYRSVLVLRCYEEMSFSEIAQLMNCKEFGARIMFFRARHALKRHLFRHGFGKEMLLTGLGLFGFLSHSTKATTTTYSVNTSSLNIGIAATLAGSLQTKMGVAVVTSIIAILASIAFQNVIVSIIVIALVLAGLYIASLYSCFD